MENISGKPKSFLLSFTFVGIMLIIMGSTFVSIALIFQIIPLTPEDINMFVNGVRQPATLETLRNFRLLFLAIFGGIGLILLIIGGIIIGRLQTVRKKEQYLKTSGICLLAEVVELEFSSLRVNNRPTRYLQCLYTDAKGKAYIFKSRILRINPIPYLDEDKIKIYHERGNMRNYFVDVDGSIKAQLF